jgi:hypothetical protein
METRRGLINFALVALLSFCAPGLMVSSRAGQAKDSKNVEEKLIGAAFGFANSAGTELIVTDQNAPESAAVVKTFTSAVCPGGRSFAVTFVGHQSGSKKDSGRDTSRNFENLAGSVFHLVRGKVDKEADSCLLVGQQFVEGKRLLPLKVLFREQGTAGAPRCDAATRHSLTKQQGRAPVACWQLAQIGKNGKLLATVYDARGKDLLAALVLEIGEKHFVHEMPAEANSISAWREGDGGKFDPTTLVPLFALQDGGDGSWDVAISWAGEEGANLDVYRSSGVALKTVVKGFRYWYPE